MYQLITIHNDEEVWRSRPVEGIKAAENSLKTMACREKHIVTTDFSCDYSYRLVNLETDEVIWKPGQKELTIDQVLRDGTRQTVTFKIVNI